MLLAWFRTQIIELNCFGHEEGSQLEEENEGIPSPNRLTLQEQRLATRLYILLLYSKQLSIGKFSRLQSFVILTAPSLRIYNIHLTDRIFHFFQSFY